MEALTSIARAGADMTITYYAKEVVRWLQNAASDVPAVVQQPVHAH